jgi:glycosyltransferase involved in cell wall biosynthesis
MVIARWKWESLAYEFSGIENPLSAPRYRWARPFASLFDKVHLRAARQANNLFAAADQQAIAQLVTRSQGILANREIVQSPTSFDSNCFKPVPKDAARRLLGLDVNVPILIASGRISSVKGWDFLLDAFDRFKITHGNALMIFVGDGEDRLQLERQVQTRQLTKSVRITGFESPERVALYINAGDVALLGSRREGWPTAIVEALACGRPVVSTHVSGASTLILNGLNGQVVEGRDPTSFARAISSVLDMPDAAAVSLEVASRYTLGAFGSRLAEHWGPLRSTSEQLSRESRFGCPQESLVPHV